jgi:hypothetical protein
MKKRGSVISVAALIIVLCVVLGVMYGMNAPKKHAHLIEHDFVDSPGEVSGHAD